MTNEKNKSITTEYSEAFPEADLWRLLFKEVLELRSVVDQLFKLLTTDKPRGS